MWTRTIGCAAAGLALMASGVAAQGRNRGRDVPPGQRPPAGMCRVWIDGVPPGRQPRATDCETAQRQRRPGSRIIYGEDRRAREREMRRTRDFDRDRRREWELEREAWRRRAERRDRFDSRIPNDPSRCSVDWRRCEGGSIDRGGYPSEMPMMRSASMYRLGVRTPDAEAWLGTARYSVDLDRGEARWTASDGQLVQVWHDDNRDGRVDRVDIVRNGRVVRTIR
jgi:hypothetical protein